jgi:alpha-L-arabinofuranosidase
MGLYGPFWGEKEYLRNVEKIEALLSSYPEQPVNHSVWYRFPARQGKIKLLIDEWNIWQYQDDGIYGLHMQYNWRDAIWVASMLNRFIADEQIAGCNMAQLCNIIAPILADDNGCYTQTIFTPCAAYRKQMYGKRLAVAIDGQYQIADEKAGEIEAVSAAAVEKDGTLQLAVVNRDFTNSIAVLLPVKAQGILYHAAPEAKNTNQTDCVQQTAVSVTPGEPFLLPAGGLLLL